MEFLFESFGDEGCPTLAASDATDIRRVDIESLSDSPIDTAE
jgi:hypothetical protein